MTSTQVQAREVAMDDDSELRSFGYEPQLSRSMGLWSSLSISISCMCITAGIFTVFAYSLGTVGPVFIWTWPIVAVGQILVTLVLCELAGHMPLSGYAFQWTSRLQNSHYGWFVGWAGLMAFTPGFTGLNLGLAPILSNRLGIEITPTNMMLVAVVLTVVEMGINLAGVAIASRINNIAAFTAELGLSIILTLILLIVGFVTHPVQSIGFLGTSSAGGSDFTVAFLLSGLLGIWVLTGQEGAADLAEETQGARRNVPRALLTSIIISSVIGFFMIVALTINIPNLADVTAAPVPIIAVLESALGKSGALLFEIVAMVALFAGGLANMAASSRLIFSLSRDKMLPGSEMLSKVNASRTPTAAILVAATLSIIIVVVGTYIATSTMALVVGMASVGYYAVYGLTILAAILSTRRGALSGTSTFSLGNWATPIRWIAFIWTVLVVVELTVPTANQQTALMAGVFFLIAAAWYVLVLRGRLNSGAAGTPASSKPVSAEAAPGSAYGG